VRGGRHHRIIFVGSPHSAGAATAAGGGGLCSCLVNESDEWYNSRWEAVIVVNTLICHFDVQTPCPDPRPRLVFILSRLAGCLSRLARKQVISGQSKWSTVHPFHQRRPVQSNGAVIRYLHSDGMNEMMLCMLNYTNFLFCDVNSVHYSGY